jgi:hypothetical protein
MLILCCFQGPSGIAINSTTFIAAVLGFASIENLRALRRKTHRKLEYLGQPLKMINSPKWNPVASGYTGILFSFDSQ